MSCSGYRVNPHQGHTGPPEDGGKPLHFQHKGKKTHPKIERHPAQHHDEGNLLFLSVGDNLHNLGMRDTPG
jgi:hypothetical protein